MPKWQKRLNTHKNMNHQDLRLTFECVRALTSLNPDLQVNRGCNLKWKPGDEKDILLATTVFLRGKTISFQSIN
jgi:hypothetical protein